MYADSFSRGAERTGDGRAPLLQAAATALLIGLVGCFGTLQVWVLALAGGTISWSIARRDGSEPAAADRSATWLKVAFIVVLCGAAFDNRLQHIDPLRPSALGVAALALIGAGLYLRHRAMTALGRHFSVKVVLLEDHCLVDGGPFRLIRHPNYAGLVLVMLGTAIALQSPVALGAALLVWLPALLVRIRHEEAALQGHFGERYARYARRTWRLCPGVF